jgi:hypothetical protein
MDTLPLVALVVAAAVGIIGTLAILRRQRLEAQGPRESPFAASTEGEKRCPSCGMGNLWTDVRCVACGDALPA